MSLPFHELRGCRHSFAGVRRSAVLRADDVVALMRQIRIVFVKKAILTAIRGAFRDESMEAESTGLTGADGAYGAIL
jgi:hypothetical protein